MTCFRCIAVGTVIGFVILILAFVFFVSGDAWGEEMIPPTPEEAADIAKWIPAACCRTNNCCRKVSPYALIPLPQNEIRVASTGQVLPRTGWSQDQNTWRCACDLQRDGTWLVHPMARTLCVFDHPQGY